MIGDGISSPYSYFSLMDGVSYDDSSLCSPFQDDLRVYLVPLKWWKEAQGFTFDSDGNKAVLYTASTTSVGPGPMKIINNFFNPDLVFNLKREEFSTPNGEGDEAVFSGRDYALVPGEMWLQALKWHSDSKIGFKEVRSSSTAEDDIADVYPLQLRLSPWKESKSIGVKISKKDNAPELFRRAYKIFSIDSEQLHIWDFSGKIMLFFTNDKNKFPKDSPRQLDQDILLEMQIYGLSDSVKCKEGKKDDMALHHPSFTGSSYSLINGISANTNTSFLRSNGSYSGGCSSSEETGSVGLTGLQNLGNTCFMNSAIQCLVHTPKLVDYFLADYSREINRDNPLGMQGELALGFGDLLRRLWAPGANPVAPRLFKSKIAYFAPQFGGFNQHDSQELLAFLLDGLHEDLNRVKCKPYVEAKDEDGKSDDEVADEYWRNHLARNDSIIVDLCQGQYKSTLVCPDCQKVSITFDPFMHLSLPLPSATVRSMTLTLVSSDGSTMPSYVTVTVPKQGKYEDLINALRISCSLDVDESLLVAEVYNSRIIRYLEEFSDSLSLIRDEDRLVAYRLPKSDEDAKLLVFMHEKLEEQCMHGKFSLGWKAIGIPLVTSASDLSCGSDIYNEYFKLLKPFLVEDENTAIFEPFVIKDEDTTVLLEESQEVTNSETSPSTNSPEDSSDIKIHLTDERGRIKTSRIKNGEPIPLGIIPSRLNVLVSWSEKFIEKIDTRPFASLPEISRHGRRPQESVALYKCLEAFLKEEPLGPEDMWFCPACKKHCQASKKLDLWRLPEILVIHLKRFSYCRFMKNKLETYVDFPIDDLDLSGYIAHKKENSPCRYELYAVTNHYGNMGGGHYTAFVNHGDDQWYDFDDSHVYPISKERLKSPAAYVLFYRRISDEDSSE